jgi:peptide chain release factor 2
LGGFFEVPAKEQQISDLEVRSSQPGFWEQGETSQKVMAEMAALKETVARWKKLRAEGEDLQAHLELAQEAGGESEGEEIEAGLKKLARDLDAMDLESKLSGEHDRSNAIVNLHAGAGGTEACDWCDMLYRMYTRWAAAKGFETEIADIMPGEEAGIKSVTFFIKGTYAYGYMKSEVGVHRLVRISPFDANKRRHTSFSSCDVLPEIDENIKIDINESDLRIDTYRSGGAGGQHVNKTESAVRITHIPTGVVVASQIERSQHKNKATAMKMLRAKMFEIEMEKKRSSAEKHYDDKGDIAWGNQIRSYVFMPYQLVKDLRTGVETGNIEKVMDGDLDAFMKSYLSMKEKK